MFFFDYTTFFLSLVQSAQTTAVSTSCATPVTSSAVTPIPSAPPSNGWWVKYDHLNEKVYTSATCNLGVITSQPHLWPTLRSLYFVWQCFGIKLWQYFVYKI
nr:uncharacterized protein LOC124808080 [Hydra vulgaris]